MNRSAQIRQSGFALFTALWMAAVLGILGVAALNSSLSTVNTIGANRQALMALKLQNAALKSAVYDIMRPRKKAALAGIPRPKFTYVTVVGNVDVSVQNEAAFLDINLIEPQLLDQVLTKLNIESSIVTALSQIKNTGKQVNSQFNFNGAKARSVKPNTFAGINEQLGGDRDAFAQVLPYITFYSGRAQINPLIASDALLGALPELSQSDVAALIQSREQSSPDLLSDAINHPMLSNRVSNHYRIRTDLELGSRRYSKTRIVKLSLQSEPFFEVVAEL